MSGTINDWYRAHRRRGLRELAEKVGTTDHYLMQLNYNPAKRPSADLALRLIEATDGAITLEGLCNPVKRLMSEP